MEGDCSCYVYANFIHARVLLMAFVPSLLCNIFRMNLNFFKKCIKNDNKSVEC